MASSPPIYYRKRTQSSSYPRFPSFPYPHTIYHHPDAPFAFPHSLPQRAPRRHAHPPPTPHLQPTPAPRNHSPPPQSALRTSPPIATPSSSSPSNLPGICPSPILPPWALPQPTPQLPIYLDILPQQSLNLAHDAQRRLPAPPPRSHFCLFMRLGVSGKGPEGQPLPRGRLPRQLLPSHDTASRSGSGDGGRREVWMGGRRVIGGERGRFRNCCGRRRSTWCIVSTALMALLLVVTAGVFLIGFMKPKGREKW